MATLHVNLDDLAQMVAVLKQAVPKLSDAFIQLRSAEYQALSNWEGNQRTQAEQELSIILTLLREADFANRQLDEELERLLEKVSKADHIRTADATLFRLRDEL